MTALGYYAKGLGGSRDACEGTMLDLLNLLTCFHFPPHSLFHRDHGSKSCLSTEHMLVCFVRLLQWELLDYAVDVVQARKAHGFLAIHGMTRGPAADTQPFHDHRIGVDADFPTC